MELTHPQSKETPAPTAGHITEQDALRIVQNNVAGLSKFIVALKMRRAVSTDRVAYLFRHVVDTQFTSDTAQLAAQMQEDGWEADLSAGETFTKIAENAVAYLSTEEGTALFNSAVQAFGRTKGEMFD